MSLYSRENNVIAVDCGYYGQRFNGPEGKFIARLYVSDDPPKLLKEETNEHCHFEFKALSYSTTYRVEVCKIHTFGDTHLSSNAPTADNQSFSLSR